MDIQRRYQIFVSSTYEDLRPERAQVAQAILELGHFPSGMELFPASDETQWDVIRKVIDESDYYIVVVAGRYGSTDTEGLAYTEKEFDYAAAKGIPILGFVRKNVENLPNKYCENGSTARHALEKFRKKDQGRLCRFYETPEELGLVVTKSLIHAISSYARTGWVRADQAKNVEDFTLIESLRTKIGDLEKRNEELEGYLRDSVLPDADIQPDQLQDDNDIFDLSIRYKRGQQAVSERLGVSWQEIFCAIGPALYGYLRKREPDVYGRDYFDRTLEGLVRTKIPDKVGSARVTLADAEIDTILFQFKQLGYLKLEKNEKDFYGWTLTEKGESKLTRLKVRAREK